MYTHDMHKTPHNGVWKEGDGRYKRTEEKGERGETLIDGSVYTICAYNPRPDAAR
jgi:hypothetical protein